MSLDSASAGQALIFILQKAMHLCVVMQEVSQIFVYVKHLFNGNSPAWYFAQSAAIASYMDQLELVFKLLVHLQLT